MALWRADIAFGRPGAGGVPSGWGSFLRGFANKRGEFFHHMGEISETSGLEVVWGTFFAGTKGPFGGFLLPETDPLGPAGARVLINRV
jgi:hypothetical protein